MPSPGGKTAGPISSKKMKGPTICRADDGSTRRTLKPPPRSRERGTMRTATGPWLRVQTGWNAGWVLMSLSRWQSVRLWCHGRRGGSDSPPPFDATGRNFRSPGAGPSARLRNDPVTCAKDKQ